jgi:hypothetical protein
MNYYGDHIKQSDIGGYIAHMRKIRNAYKILVGKTDSHPRPSSCSVFAIIHDLRVQIRQRPMDFNDNTLCSKTSLDRK